MHPYLDWAGPIAFAHRGGNRRFSENSLEAFQDAYQLGYRYLETDVHVSTDGEVVLLHDDTLDRMTDRSGPVEALPWREIAATRLGPNGLHIPRLTDLLEHFPDARINLDTKSDRVVEPLAKLLNRGNWWERVSVCSFFDQRIARIRRLSGGQACTGMGPVALAAARLPTWLGIAPRRFGADCIQTLESAGPLRIVTPQFVDMAHHSRLPVHVWTVNERGDMERLLDLGIDGLMTDDPALLKEVLQERQSWPDPATKVSRTRFQASGHDSASR